MMMKYKNLDLGVLILRVALAAVFIFYGWAKFSGIDGAITFFGGLGFPSIVAYFVAAVELLGGVALLLGIFTDIVGVLFAIIMIVAVVSVTGAKGFMGGWDFNLILLAASLCVALIGPGKYSLMKHSMGKMEM